jgi:hypothetical protein
MSHSADWVARNCRLAGAGPDALFPRAGPVVGGLAVLPDVPNLSSIGSSFDEGEYRVLPGVREVSMSHFGGPRTVFYAADDLARSHALAGQIRASGEIKPLIIAVDDKGPYILEGAHRYVALCELGAKSFPAVVVVEEPTS